MPESRVSLQGSKGGKTYDMGCSRARRASPSGGEHAPSQVRLHRATMQGGPWRGVVRLESRAWRGWREVEGSSDPPRGLTSLRPARPAASSRSSLASSPASGERCQWRPRTDSPDGPLPPGPRGQDVCARRAYGHAAVCGSSQTRFQRDKQSSRALREEQRGVVQAFKAFWRWWCTPRWARRQGARHGAHSLSARGGGAGPPDEIAMRQCCLRNPFAPASQPASWEPGAPSRGYLEFIASNPGMSVHFTYFEINAGRRCGRDRRRSCCEERRWRTAF